MLGAGHPPLHRRIGVDSLLQRPRLDGRRPQVTAFEARPEAVHDRRIIAAGQVAPPDRSGEQQVAAEQDGRIAALITGALITGALITGA